MIGFSLPKVLSLSSSFYGGGEGWNEPVLRHRILTWFPAAGSVSARSAGAKNMASSSGWAVRRQIRLFVGRGKRARVRWAVER